VFAMVFATDRGGVWCGVVVVHCTGQGTYYCWCVYMLATATITVYTLTFAEGEQRVQDSKPILKNVLVL
jgi:hypothetical protein